MSSHNREPAATAREELGDITEQIAELGTMTAGELRDKYLEVYGEPTRSRNKIYLQKKIAWQIQALAEGGLSQRALDRIEELAPLAPLRWRPRLKNIEIPLPPTTRGKKTKKRDSRLPPPGAVITKEHKGMLHQVTVVDDGFEYAGDCYASLSKVARVIAGTSWNGFAFFGLRNKDAR